MLSKKARQKLMKKRISSIARVIACASFLILTIIGVSSLVRAMSLETIANENGIPASWHTASLGNPESITIPASFWDQRQDDCDDPNRQFEWVICGYWTAGALQGIVKDSLGDDGLPIPSFVTASAAWNAHRDVFTTNVTGHDPVLPSDNFYRWFHETEVSKRYDREVVFHRTDKNTYSYGRDGVFPLDDVDFSDGDSAWEKHDHNYHFTSHMRIPVKISANGKERFYFSGDDDVWIFLNNRLVIDLGGLHEKLEGWFQVNTDGTVSTFVQNVNDTSVRDQLGEPSNDFNSYVNPLNELNRATFQNQHRTLDIGLTKGDVVNLDFFYAERSTTESNTNVTITNMNWPISANSKVKGEVVGQIENSDNRLIEFKTSIANRDTANPLILENLAAYIDETTPQGTNQGFIPLSSNTLHYTFTPEDEDSWQPLEISAPSTNENGFKLRDSLTMAPAGTDGDTIYFRFFAETTGHTGEMTSIVSYYTTLNGSAGVTYDYDTVTYETKVIEPTPTDPETPVEAPVEPESPDPEPEVPTAPELPILPIFPSSDLINEELTYLAPLGEIAYVPNTGIVSDIVATVFEVGFAEIILSQSFVMVMLVIFAGSFATWFSLRKFANFDPAVRTYSAKKTHPKMPVNKKVAPRTKSARNAHATRTRNSKMTRKTTKK